MEPVDRKISETLIDFARPFISTINHGTTEQEVQAGFMIVSAVWNAYVLAEIRNDPTYLDGLGAIAGNESAEAQKMISTLIDRKKKIFSGDRRGIGAITVSFKKGRLNVRAEARQVDELPTH